MSPPAGARSTRGGLSPAGHVVAAADLIALRPGVGLPADRQGDLIGQRLGRDVAAGAPFVVADLWADDKETEHVA